MGFTVSVENSVEQHIGFIDRATEIVQKNNGFISKPGPGNRATRLRPPILGPDFKNSFLDRE